MGFSFGLGEECGSSFWFRGRMWDSLAVGSDHCLSFYFDPWKKHYA